MGKDCRAGWTELQDYRRVKGLQWIRSDETDSRNERIMIQWDWRGLTDSSRAEWFVWVESGQDQIQWYPITAPSKTTGSFRLKNRSHRALLEKDINTPPANAQKADERMAQWLGGIPEWIEAYESVGAPLGSFAWLRRV